MKIFDILKKITQTKENINFDNEEIDKAYDIYMLNRFISMSRIFLPLVNQINKFSNLPKHIHYEFFRSTLPKRYQFFKYIKKGKDANKHEKECIMRYYEVGKKEADLYVDLLTEEQIKKIVNKFKYGKTK